MPSSLHAKLKWGGIICLVLVGLGAFIFWRFHASLWVEAVKLYNLLNNPQQLKETLTAFGPYAPLIFVLIQAAQVFLAPIPGGPVAFVGGYLFGAKAGFLYSTLGQTAGSWIAFSIAKMFEKRFVEKFVSPQTLKKFDYLIGHVGVLISFLLFLIPGFPKDVLCYILGLTPMHMGIFLVVSTVGRIPGTLMATLQGAQAFNHQYIMFFILLGISVLIALVFYIYHEQIHKWLKSLR